MNTHGSIMGPLLDERDALAARLAEAEALLREYLDPYAESYDCGYEICAECAPQRRLREFLRLADNASQPMQSFSDDANCSANDAATSADHQESERA